MKNYLVLLITVLILIITAGCVSNPVNRKTASNYYDAGSEAEQMGDYKVARINYYRAYQNAKMGNLGKKSEAYALYEWSRVTGYLGLYSESQKGFSDTLDIIAESEGEADELLAPTLSEYARLLHDTGQHEKAIEVYEMATGELEKVGIMESDPVGYSVFLEEYSISLEKAGLSERSSEVASKALVIRQPYGNEKPKFDGKRY